MINQIIEFLTSPPDIKTITYFFITLLATVVIVGNYMLWKDEKETEEEQKKNLSPNPLLFL